MLLSRERLLAAENILIFAIVDADGDEAKRFLIQKVLFPLSKRKKKREREKGRRIF